MPPAARCRYWTCTVRMVCILHCRAGVQSPAQEPPLRGGWPTKRACGRSARRTLNFIVFEKSLVRRGQGPALQTGGNGRCTRKPRAGRTPAGPHICGPYKPPGNGRQTGNAAFATDFAAKHSCCRRTPLQNKWPGPRLGPRLSAWGGQNSVVVAQHQRQAPGVPLEIRPTGNPPPRSRVPAGGAGRGRPGGSSAAARASAPAPGLRTPAAAPHCKAARRAASARRPGTARRGRRRR